MPSFLEDSCVSVDVDNCLSYSYIDCSECSGSYEVNPFKYYEDIFEDDGSLMRLLQKMNFSLFQTNFTFSVC